MNKIIIGMLHLLPLPGSPNYSGSMDDVLNRAKSDLENLLEGGLTKINIENYGDIPFPKIPSSPITISSFTICKLRNSDNGSSDVSVDAKIVVNIYPVIL